MESPRPSSSASREYGVNDDNEYSLPGSKSPNWPGYYDILLKVLEQARSIH